MEFQIRKLEFNLRTDKALLITIVIYVFMYPNITLLDQRNSLEFDYKNKSKRLENVWCFQRCRNKQKIRKSLTNLLVRLQVS